jgi:hypothetical protein
MTEWQKQRSERAARLEAGSRYATGKIVSPEKADALLEATGFTLHMTKAVMSGRLDAIVDLAAANLWR